MSVSNTEVLTHANLTGNLPCVIISLPWSAFCCVHKMGKWKPKYGNGSTEMKVRKWDANYQCLVPYWSHDYVCWVFVVKR